MSRPIRRSVNHAAATRTAAARILGCLPAQIRRFELWTHVAFVHVAGRRPTFVSFKAFERDFLEFRLVGSDRIEILTEVSGLYTVYSHKSGKTYQVDRCTGSCECEDWNRQLLRGSSDPICKHLLKVNESIEQARPITEADALASLGF